MELAATPVRTRVHPLQSLVLDIFERLIPLALFGWMVARISPSLVLQPYNVLLLITEAFTVIILLLRRRGEMMETRHAWVIALIGSYAGMLVLANGISIVPAWLGAGMMFAGLTLSLCAKLFLNRSFGLVAANRGVKRSGPYRLVRHPMYMAYIIIHVGFVLMHLSVWNLLIHAICYTAMGLRIRAEEAFLNLDPEYREYASVVKYRLVPGLF